MSIHNETNTTCTRLINGPYGVYARDASNNHYERLITRDNYESGFQIQGVSENNTVIYLDSYRNRDPRKNGESADGFACKEGSGKGNVLRNSRCKSPSHRVVRESGHLEPTLPSYLEAN